MRNDLHISDKDLHQLAMHDPDLATVTLEQIARTYGVSMRTLRTYTKNGTLPAARVGSRMRVTLANLKQFLAGRKHAA